MNKKLLALILLAPWCASAEPVTVYYSAEVTGIFQDPGGFFDAVNVVPGAKITGSFVYDSATTNFDSFVNQDRWTYLDFAVTGLPGEFTPDFISASTVIGDIPPEDIFDDWLLRATWDLLPQGAIGFRLREPDLGYQTTDPSAPGFVGEGSGHPIIVPDPLSLITEGSIAYVIFDDAGVVQIGGAFLAAQLSLDPFVEDQIENIADTVMDLNINNGIANSLDAKLDSVLRALDDVNESNDVAAVNSLVAFINSVEAQRGSKLEEADACNLIQAADSIIVSLGGVSTGSTCLSQ
jgi:hypothetical protein